MRCPASCPIPSPISRFFFGCSLDKSLAHFFVLSTRSFYIISDEQYTTAKKAQLKWNGKCRQLFSSVRLRQVVWWSNCTWLDWLNPFLHSSLTCSLIHLLIHSTSTFQVLPVCLVSDHCPVFHLDTFVCLGTWFITIWGQGRWAEESLQSHILGRPWFLGRSGSGGSDICVPGPSPMSTSI